MLPAVTLTQAKCKTSEKTIRKDEEGKRSEMRREKGQCPSPVKPFLFRGCVIVAPLEHMFLILLSPILQPVGTQRWTFVLFLVILTS